MLDTRLVKDFGSFYQKTLEPIFSKDCKTTALPQLKLRPSRSFWNIIIIQSTSHDDLTEKLVALVSLAKPPIK